MLSLKNGPIHKLRSVQNLVSMAIYLLLCMSKVHGTNLRLIEKKKNYLRFEPMTST